MTREEKFKEELKKLLKKYDVEITLEDRGLWQSDNIISFYGNSKYYEGELIYGEFEFTGRYFGGDRV
jgi:hypothetical protein